jgi:hypothetical protein
LCDRPTLARQMGQTNGPGGAPSDVRASLRAANEWAGSPIHIVFKLHQRQSVSESVLYLHIIVERGRVAMAGGVKREKAVTQIRLPVEAHVSNARNSHENQVRPTGSSKRNREATTPRKSNYCGCGAMALHAIGFGLYCLRRLGNLYEIRSGTTFRLHRMAGVNVWPDSTGHRSCMLCFGNGARSPWTGKTGPINGLWLSENFAIWRRERLMRYRENLRTPHDLKLPAAIERKELK